MNGTRRFVAQTTVLFAALTAVMTLPQVLHLADGVADDGDPLLVTWIFGWVAHQLPRAPGHLFDANIFFPERRTLAFSETLLAPAVAAAPLYWIGAGRIFIYNVLFLLGFIASGVATAVLVRSLTGRRDAAVVAGIIFAFLPFRIGQYSHLQLQHTEWMPLALLAAHALVRTGRMASGVWVGVCVACQALSSIYYGVFLAVYLAVVICVLFAGSGGASRPRLLALGAGALTAIVLLTPVAAVYTGARAVVGERGFAEAAANSATWRSYLAASPLSLVYGRVLGLAEPERILFPGFVPIVLAVAALKRSATPGRAMAQGPDVVAQDFSPAHRWAYVLGLVVAFDISLGTHGLTYPLLYRFVLPFRALRVPARMGVMVGLSLAVLAGYGFARATERLTPRRRWFAAALAAAAILIEFASRPIPLQIIPAAAPAAYADLLRDRGDGPPAAIVEYPMGEHNDPTYMYYSTFHWQPLANGYSGFYPPSYEDLRFVFESFPSDEAISAVRARGIRYLLVHGERMIGDRYTRMLPQLDRRSDLVLVSRSPAERQGQHGEVSLYRVVY